MWRYANTDGDYLLGIPARDMTDAEFAELGEDEAKAVAASGLYEEVEGTDDRPSTGPAGGADAVGTDAGPAAQPESDPGPGGDGDDDAPAPAGGSAIVGQGPDDDGAVG